MRLQWLLQSRLPGPLKAQLLLCSRTGRDGLSESGSMCWERQDEVCGMRVQGSGLHRGVLLRPLGLLQHAPQEAISGGGEEAAGSGGEPTGVEEAAGSAALITGFAVREP